MRLHTAAVLEEDEIEDFASSVAQLEKDGDATDDEFDVLDLLLDETE